MYTIETVIFQASGQSRQIRYQNEWEILLRGFEKSAKNTKGKVNIHRVDKLKARKRLELSVNHYKLKVWRDIVREAEHPLVLVDTDVCFLDDIECGFTDKPITLTSRARRWCNAGVVFVRPSEEANLFFDRWCEMDDWVHQGEMDSKGNPIRLKKAWQQTGVKGHNQTALALIKDEFEFGWVSGAIYNASQPEEWKGTPKVVHVKDSMRRDVMLYGAGHDVRNELAKKIVSYYY